jgi:L-threonylcarbamoyladenylate synthase
MQFLVSQPNPADLAEAAKALRQGSLVAFPTETVYGLGADAENPTAVARIYETKNRPANHPLIVHLASAEEVGHWAVDVPEYAKALMADYWPGPLTLLLKRGPSVQNFITGGQETVGLRVPNHPLALGLLNCFKLEGGHGLAAPSANRYGAVSPTSAQDVADELAPYLGPKDLILDGGTASVGVESTIVDCTGSSPVILRPGAITAQMIEQSSGIIVQDPTQLSPRVSGSHKQHYSPKAKVTVGADCAQGEGFIALAHVATPNGAVRLAAPKNEQEYARELYAALRKADSLGLAAVSILPPQGEGLALAIRDRISRAAAK